MGWIYKIVNQINWKMYIGKTEHDNPFKRWEEHLRDYKRPRCEKRPLYDAMKKYGVENFIFEPIGQFENGQVLCDKEKEYIALYRTYVGFKDCNGYNATLGGDGKSYLNLNDKEVISYHLNNGSVIGKTSKYFGCDEKSIAKILNNYDVDWLDFDDVIRKKFLLNYGGLVQLDRDCTRIIQIFDCPMDVREKYKDYKKTSLKNAYILGHGTNRYKNYTWYRLNELPEEYKPLLNEYYERIINDDNQEIDDLIFD